MDDAVSLSRSGRVAAVTLSRPDRHNALDGPMVAALAAALEQAAADDSVRAVVLAAAGRSFCAGMDLRWMRRMAAAPAAENVADALALARLMRVLDGLPKPTVARVQGGAHGGGAGLVAACDIAVAAAGARFSFPETRLGLIPAVIGPPVIAAIGARAARRCFLTGEVFDAAEALRLGLVHRVVADDALDAAVAAAAGHLVAGGPHAQREAKALVRDVAAAAPGEDFGPEAARRIARLRAGDEGREGIAAFLDRRPPAWRDG